MKASQGEEKKRRGLGGEEERRREENVSAGEDLERKRQLCRLIETRILSWLLRRRPPCPKGGGSRDQEQSPSEKGETTNKRKNKKEREPQKPKNPTLQSTIERPTRGPA